MNLALQRPSSQVCRHALSRRWASSAAQGAAQTAQARAVQGLSRVSSSAGSAVSSMGSSASTVASYAQGIVPPLVHYSKVGFELSRLVARGRQMYPPDASTFQRVYEPFIHAFRNPVSTFRQLNTPANSPSNLLKRIGDISTGQVVGAAVLTAELLGFFTVGEMLGRLKLIGYHGHVEHHE